MTQENPTPHGLIVIGGVSGAGKSSLSKRLASEFGFPQYELDKMFNRLKKPFEEMVSLSEEQRRDHRNNLMTEIASELLQCFASLDTTAILEGGWITPVEIKSMSGMGPPLVSVFLGYGGSGRIRLENFQQGNSHWSVGKELPEQERERVECFFDKQIRKSVLLRKDCSEFGLKYIDTTEENGFERAFRYLKSEVERFR